MDLWWDIPGNVRRISRESTSEMALSRLELAGDAIPEVDGYLLLRRRGVDGLD